MNKTVCATLVLVNLFLVTSPLMGNDLREFLCRPLLSNLEAVATDCVNIRTGTVLCFATSRAIQGKLEKRKFSRIVFFSEKSTKKIVLFTAKYSTNFAFVAAMNGPKEAIKTVGIQIVVDQIYEKIADTIELDYPTFIKEHPYLYKPVRFFLPIITKHCMRSLIKCLIFKSSDQNK